MLSRAQQERDSTRGSREEGWRGATRGVWAGLARAQARALRAPQQPGTLPRRLEGAGREPEVVSDLPPAAAAAEGNAALLQREEKGPGASLLS